MGTGEKPKLTKNIRWVSIKGFRSISSSRLEIHPNCNIIMGLNDHGKSNYLRAIHLFFKGEVEPGVFVDYDRDLCTKGKRASSFIEIEIGFNQKLAHPQLLSTIKRKRIRGEDEFSIRRTWRRSEGGLESKIEICINSPKKGKRVYSTDRLMRGRKGEAIGPVHAPIRYDSEINRFLNKFKVRYLPSSTTGKLFEEAGLARELKEYCFDSYQKTLEYQELSSSISDVREKFKGIIQSHFGSRVGASLSKQFPGIDAINIDLPNRDSDLIHTNDLELLRRDKTYNLANCGSGLQSIVILETLEYLDSNIVVRGNELSPEVIWLIEEPEAFLYEDLIHSVGEKMNNAALEFNVLITSHNRELALSTEGVVNWVNLFDKGSDIVKRFDLSEEEGKEEINEYARSHFGESFVETKAQQEIEKLKVIDDGRLLIVEGICDEIVLKRVFELLPPGKGSIEIRRPITDTDNALNVSKSVLAISPHLQGNKLVLGLFDNDYEGVQRFKAADEKIRSNSLTNAKIMLLPSCASHKKVSLGELNPDNSEGEDLVIARNKNANITGKSLNLEAFYDEESVVKVLIEEGLLYKFWLLKLDDKGNVHFSNVVPGKNKKKIALRVAELLTKEKMGSLKILRDKIVSKLRLEND